MEAALIIGVVAATMAAFCWAAYHFEKREWNNGVCRHCGGMWRSFDIDSSGAIGYKCQSGHSIWISWFKAKEIDPMGFLR